MQHDSTIHFNFQLQQMRDIFTLHPNIWSY